MTERKPVNARELQRYRLWEAKLSQIKRHARFADAATGGPKREARLDIGLACQELDRLVVPPGWRSWQELGQAIYYPHLHREASEQSQIRG